MTDFSDCIDYIDRVKIEFHERFRHILEAIAALEAKMTKLEEYVYEPVTITSVIYDAEAALGGKQK